MKKLMITGMLLTLAGFGGSAFAQSGEILMTAQRSGGDIELVFEALNEGGVVALQYELKMAGISPEQVDLSGCVGAFKSSQLAGCHMAKGAVRAAIINEGLAELPTGEIGRITLRGMKSLPAGMTLTNATIVDRTGNERAVKVLADFAGLQDELTQPLPGHRVE